MSSVPKGDAGYTQLGLARRILTARRADRSLLGHARGFLEVHLRGRAWDGSERDRPEPSFMDRKVVIDSSIG